MKNGNNNGLSAPDQSTQIQGKQKMDECRLGFLHKRRELDFTKPNKMDGCRPSHTVSMSSSSAVWYLQWGRWKKGPMSFLTANKDRRKGCWKVGQEQTGLL